MIGGTESAAFQHSVVGKRTSSPRFGRPHSPGISREPDTLTQFTEGADITLGESKPRPAASACPASSGDQAMGNAFTVNAR